MQSVPLTIAPDGGIRIANTRVSLDSLIYQYEGGASAEEIASKFPGLGLADIHSCIAYYLNHHEEIDEYLAQRRQAADELQETISSDPQQQRGLTHMRERIKTRSGERQQKTS